MFEQRNHRKSRILIVVFALLVVIIGIFAYAVFGYGKSNGKINDVEARKIIKQRREAVMELMTVLRAYATDHQNTFPTVTDANRVVTDHLKAPLLEPATKKAFVIQSGPPTAPHEVQYATSTTCTDNLSAFRPSLSSGDVALRIQDDLTNYFCFPNRLDNR